MKTIYIFSLGNPDLDGKVKYKYTRHNAARLLCDAFDFEKFNAASVVSSQKEVKYNIIFEYVVPNCFMNLSGKFILDYIKYKNIEVSAVVIAYDDIDINFGEIKLSYSRSAGGHNGVESVIENLKTKDFYRIRIGIGQKPIKEMLLQDYVLSKLSEEEVNTLTFKNQNKTGENSINLENILKNKLEELTKLISN
jgi:PTH1 family peptidyl-tRNA hydrolase